MLIVCRLHPDLRSKLRRLCCSPGALGLFLRAPVDAGIREAGGEPIAQMRPTSAEYELSAVWILEPIAEGVRARISRWHQCAIIMNLIDMT